MTKIIKGGLVYGGTSSPYIQLTGTLAAGETSLTILNSNISSSSTIDVYVDEAFTGVAPTACILTSGSVTLTFPVQETNMPVKVRIS